MTLEQKNIDDLVDQVTENIKNTIIPELHMNLDHQLLEISNQFSLKEDINYLFRYFSKTFNMPYDVNILNDLISGLDNESIDHVKSFFIKKILIASKKYANVMKYKPVDILNLIIPESHKELVNHPSKIFLCT